MCLSAPASFTLSAFLAAASCFLLYKTHSKKLRFLAAIPLFFAMQQAAEGLVWLQIPSLTSFSKNIFLFFAYSFWPLWIPLALYIAETKPQQKQGLAFLTGIGLTMGALLFIMIPSTEPTFYKFSIHYVQQNTPPSLDALVLFFYLVATILPLFLSSIHRSKMLGSVILLAALLIFLLDRYLLVSLWCFFAALLSPLIFFMIRKKSSS